MDLWRGGGSWANGIAASFLLSTGMVSLCATWHTDSCVAVVCLCLTGSFQNSFVLVCCWYPNQVWGLSMSSMRKLPCCFWLGTGVASKTEAVLFAASQRLLEEVSGSLVISMWLVFMCFGTAWRWFHWPSNGRFMIRGSDSRFHIHLLWDLMQRLRVACSEIQGLLSSVLSYVGN